ncbi:MAG: hypothetical protein CM1200mP3_10430 [Chloroflexota bacterium]|nr:MAG: hypothetical protein CM1200mP3_10430 [Chloroflexota bacterium]
MKIVPESQQRKYQNRKLGRSVFFYPISRSQFGCPEQLSGKTEKEAAFEQARGRNIIATPKIEGFEIESSYSGKLFLKQTDFSLTSWSPAVIS